ncbi:MAG TPA: hypothetical protein VN947_15190 [Polyangia bacterium]|nr:hypothetical protein [Polyangia bacterium]
MRLRCFLFLASLVPLSTSSGCDALGANPFAGTIMQLTVANAAVTPAGQHLELWARDQYNDILRIDPFYDETNYKTSYGLMIRQAVSLDDPCLIDANGNLLTDASAYPGPVTIAGVTQSPAQQAKQIVDRINQLAPPGAAPLLAVLPYDPNTPPSLPAGTTPADRLTACTNYRNQGPLTYVANPAQITAPAHGVVYGFIRFINTTPAEDYDGFRLDTPVNLAGVQEIFFTTETDSVDPNHRGPLFLTSTLTQGGREVVHFALVHADPNGSESGGAALYVNLDQDPTEF